MMPRAASHTQHVNILTMQIFTIAAAPVMGLVYAVMAYAVRFWRFRGQGVPPDGPPLRTHPRMTAIWLVVSATLTVFLLVWGLALLA
jgi:heme/copper-type cytochrome/quinol oxidase subunit 2